MVSVYRQLGSGANCGVVVLAQTQLIRIYNSVNKVYSVNKLFWPWESIGNSSQFVISWGRYKPVAHSVRQTAIHFMSFS